MTRSNKTQLQVQSLEDRCTPSVSASFAQGVLHVRGSAGDDTIMVKQMNGRIHVGGVSQSFSAAIVRAIKVEGFGGNDHIFLNSEAMGGQALSVGCAVDAGSGNDVIFGSARNDFIDGGSGDDTIFGRTGNDVLKGGAGRDRLFGDAGYDTLYGDLDDIDLRGGIGSDTIKIAGFDPSRLTNDANQIKQVVNMGISAYSFSHQGNGEKVTVKNLRVVSVEIVNGETKLKMKADIRYQKTQGFPQYSASGTIKFELKPVIHVQFTDAGRSAKIALTEVKVTEVNINNVPNWLDNSSWVRDFLTNKLSQRQPLNATSVLNLYLATGGSLGPTIVA